MKNFALAIMIVVVAAACGSNPYNIRPATSEQRHVVDKNYTLGEEQTAYVGQSVVRLKDYFGSPVPVFTSPSAFSVKLRDNFVQYPAGTQAQAAFILDHDGATYFTASPSPPMPGGAMLLIGQDGHFRGLAYTQQDEVFGACDDNDYVCVTPNTIDFAKSDTVNVTPTPGYMNFEIVYSGATKDIINLLYREYTPDNMARPAFTQNLTYDRAAPTIRFRDVQIRVIEASNESLRYVVEADGLTP